MDRGLRGRPRVAQPVADRLAPVQAPPAGPGRLGDHRGHGPAGDLRADHLAVQPARPQAHLQARRQPARLAAQNPRTLADPVRDRQRRPERVRPDRQRGPPVDAHRARDDRHRGDDRRHRRLVRRVLRRPDRRGADALRRPDADDPVPVRDPRRGPLLRRRRPDRPDGDLRALLLAGPGPARPSAVPVAPRAGLRPGCPGGRV